MGDAAVSTVFLGLDHRWEPDGPPVLYETMIFGGEHDGDMDRYCTRDAAEAGHADLVGQLRAADRLPLGARAQWRLRRLLAVIARRDRNGAIPRFEAWLTGRGVLAPPVLWRS